MLTGIRYKSKKETHQDSLSTKSVILWERKSRRKAEKGLDYFHADFKLVFLQVVGQRLFPSRFKQPNRDFKPKNPKYVQLSITQEISFHRREKFG